jgi:hypothetical protein
MSQIEITPALLADLRQKAEAYDLKEWVVDDQNVMAGVGYSKEIVAETTGKPDAEYIAAASPAVVLALVKDMAKLKVDLLETQIQCAEGVLRMFRGEQQDFTGLFSESELIAEGLDKPAEIDGTTAGIWASFIERKQLECEQYRSLVK